MAAPSSTVPTAVATRPSPTNADVGVLTYVEEVVVGAATLLQQVPVVGDVCATFLSFQQLAETAKSNTEDLEVLRDLCDVVIKGVLDKRSDRSGLPAQGVYGAREAREKSGGGIEAVQRNRHRRKDATVCVGS